jgi:hypothetical protein
VAARFDCDERGVGVKHPWRDHEWKGGRHVSSKWHTVAALYDSRIFSVRLKDGDDNQDCPSVFLPMERCDVIFFPLPDDACPEE